MGNTDRERQVLESHTSNSMGTEVPKQFLDKTTESKKTNRAIDNRPDRECKESLDKEGPNQYLAKLILQAPVKQQHKHPGPSCSKLE